MPTRDGGPQVQSSNYSLSSGNTTHVSVDISSTNLIGIHITKYGVLVSETVTLQIAVDDGTVFADYKTYSFAQINAAGGFYTTEQVKGTRARFVLSNGQVGKGLNASFFI